MKMMKRLFTVRLHLVRHGETYANREGIVLGQRESELTEQGMAQALALGETWTKKQRNRTLPNFWRVYSSDYARTQQTAALILRGGATYDEESNFRSAFTATIVPDNRLIERAKGVKEGRPKSLPYDDALQLHYQEHGKQTTTLPLLETELDVWTRTQNWINEVMLEAYHIHTGTSSYAIHNRRDLDDVYDILAVSHSATIRTIVNRLVGDQLPTTIVRGSGGKEGSETGMLKVPNTSMTIIDIAVGEHLNLNDDDDDNNNKSIQQIDAELIELTNTDHLLKHE
ncbi:phosphoglycerate mutase-like protein [Fragilariopsis cylindrus CCMP1102]|uniref:Phosphoglycerate mutase-like protein n=1 Tax=Fragilariopsis cylindrus CCMP1102 TaxID=635003 RepID=A0A1E7EZ23_9STRA|nr:phosphoglycerate mutase-like protein [Fragilariopsis cylindrus CCMP1102]|eukprot:OEU11045.1 phosphoglycerate mutase-like protein [Fragilariopsis cylindrus CCMP1102]